MTKKQTLALVVFNCPAKEIRDLLKGIEAVPSKYLSYIKEDYKQYLRDNKLKIREAFPSGYKLVVYNITDVDEEEFGMIEVMIELAGDKHLRHHEVKSSRFAEYDTSIQVDKLDRDIRMLSAEWRELERLYDTNYNIIDPSYKSLQGVVFENMEQVKDKITVVRKERHKLLKTGKSNKWKA